ncbi:MAG: SpoIIE family protein phosphatase [Thermoleophilaceae bacterium]
MPGAFDAGSGRRRLAALVESADEAVIQLDRDGLIERWNAGAQHLYGHAEDDAVGCRLTELLHAPELPEPGADGSLRDFTAGHRHRDGGELTVACTVWPVSDGGRLTGSVVVARRNDEAEELERRMRDEVQQLREAQDVAQLGAWAWQPGSNIVTWNDALYRIYGVDPQTFTPSVEEYLARVHDDDRELVLDQITRSLTTREPFEFDERIVRPGGEVRQVHSRGRVIADADGGAERMIGVSVDVTERVQGQAQLRDAMERLQEAQEIARIGSWEWDIAGNEVTWSQVLYEIYGVDSNSFEASYDAFIGFIHEDEREHVDRTIRAALESGEPFAFTHKLERPDGGLRTLDCRGRVLTDDAGRPLRMIGTALDVTEQREAEQQLAEERRIAETLQRSLLPAELPTGGDVVVAARYLPATAEVGGDWYDAMPLPGGGLGLVLGDVSGHGIRAAALMAELRHSLAAYVFDGREPAEAADRLDRLLRERGHQHIATLVYGVLEPGGVFRYVSAGHLPPLVIDDGGARLLEPEPGPPLGVGADYTEGSCHVPPGALLVLYSDGLVERRDEVLDVGLERLRALAAAGPRDPEELCDHLVAGLVPAEGGDDDVAVMVARPGAPATPRASSG